MTDHVLICHLPEDGETAAYLAADLERQGVRAHSRSTGDEHAVHAAAAVIVVISHASASSGLVRAEADRAARIGKPLYVVRLSDVSGEAFAAMPVQQWTDAFGPQAQANVAQLADLLRATAAPVAAQRSGNDPRSGYPPEASPRGGGLPAYRIVLGIVGIIVIAFGIYGLATSGVFGGGGGGSTADNAATMPYSGNGNVLASSAGDGDIAERVRHAAAQMQSRLPQQAGPITFTDAYHLKQLPKDLNLSGKFLGTLDQQTWLPMANRLSQELCKGPAGDLVRSGARIHLAVVDKVRSSYFFDVRSC